MPALTLFNPPTPLEHIGLSQPQPSPLPSTCLPLWHPQLQHPLKQEKEKKIHFKHTEVSFTAF